MNKELFKNEFNMELEGMSITEIKNLINELLNEVSSNYYEYLLCKIKYLKGEEYEINNDTLKEYDNILDNFNKIENGEICFKSYSYETGTYNYDADLDYVYFPSNELEEILVNTYELIKKLVLYKNYDRAINLFELIINTNYICEEIGNPEYDDSDEVYDVYEVDFYLIKNNLGINLNIACLYAIYSIIMSDKSNKLDKIYKYIKLCPSINIKEVKNIGIEKINNFDEFYREWSHYLKDKNNS